MVWPLRVQRLYSLLVHAVINHACWYVQVLTLHKGMPQVLGLNGSCCNHTEFLAAERQ